MRTLCLPRIFQVASGLGDLARVINPDGRVLGSKLLTYVVYRLYLHVHISWPVEKHQTAYVTLEA